MIKKKMKKNDDDYDIYECSLNQFIYQLKNNNNKSKYIF